MASRCSRLMRRYCSIIGVTGLLSAICSSSSPDVILLDEVVGMVGGLGSTQSGDPVVLLAVDKAAVGPLPPDKLPGDQLAESIIAGIDDFDRDEGHFGWAARPHG